MDLKEKTGENHIRHPWETSRLLALRRILSPHLRDGINVLDVGCGDGYVATRLFRDVKNCRIQAVDTSLTDSQIQKLASAGCGVTFGRELPGDRVFDLILLLDVIEHVEDDHAFLWDLVENRLAPDGLVLITAPAFQSLFSGHDAFLGHYRRYSLDQLVRLVRSCGVSIDRGGHLFFSLLLPKYLFFKLLKTADCSDGVGNWRRGRLLSGVIEAVLRADNSLLYFASRLGIKIPGLTGWVLCRKLR